MASVGRAAGLFNDRCENGDELPGFFNEWSEAFLADTLCCDEKT
jgi:hypothetical protein